MRVVNELISDKLKDVEIKKLTIRRGVGEDGFFYSTFLMEAHCLRENVNNSSNISKFG